MNTPVRYVANLTHVREVSLRGTADLVFWRDRLIEEDLIPAPRDGKAQILIIAAAMRYMGVRFTEVSFSVLVSAQKQGVLHTGAFLVQAFISCRLFAFCERALFSAPYYHGDCRVSVLSPVSIRLMKRGKAVFRVEMRADSSAPARVPSRSGEDGWEGPVFLPGTRRGGGSQGHLFFAKIKGHTRSYPFLPGTDTVSIRPSQDTEILQALLDSQFVGTEWAVREDATHAKSKTYKRSEALAGLPASGDSKSS